MAGSGTRTVERAHAGAHSANIAAEQPDDLDLMGQLIEGDAAALLDIELIVAMRAKQKIVVVESSGSCRAGPIRRFR